MGSGTSGLYGNTYGTNVPIEATDNVKSVDGAAGSKQTSSAEKQSQPYAESYGVTKDMLEHDKERGVYTEKKGYSLNPTAINPKKNIRDGIVADHEGKPMNGSYTYVVKEDGELVIAKRNGRGKEGKATPHPTLVGGKDPKVKIAGMVTFQDGKIVKYDNESGHFKPNVKSMPEADKAFSALPSTAFHRNFNKHMGRR